MTRTRTFLALGFLVALLLAGVGSYYASSSPDGLEKVAQDEGIAAQEKPHAAADSPFAGYGTAGVSDGRLSGGLAGVVGVGLTALVGGGLFLLLRRRSPAAAGDPADAGRDPASVPAGPDRG